MWILEPFKIQPESWKSPVKAFSDTYTVQQFPCILCITSTKRLVSCCELYNVHEKSLLERECELNYQKNREQRGKKYLVFYVSNSTISTKKVYILPFFVDFWQQYADKLHLLSLLSLGVVNRINALETMQGIHVFIWGSSFLSIKIFV